MVLPELIKDTNMHLTPLTFTKFRHTQCYTTTGLGSKGSLSALRLGFLAFAGLANGTTPFTGTETLVTCVCKLNHCSFLFCLSFHLSKLPSQRWGWLGRALRPHCRSAHDKRKCGEKTGLGRKRRRTWCSSEKVSTNSAGSFRTKGTHAWSSVLDEVTRRGGLGKSCWGLKAAVGSEGQRLEAVRELASWQLDGKLFLDGRWEVMATTSSARGPMWALAKYTHPMLIKGGSY